MHLQKIHRKDTGLFTDQQLHLSYQQEMYGDFIHQAFSEDAFASQVEIKRANYPAKHRGVLVNSLRKQYNSVATSKKTQENINALVHPNTFTITTGHQLSLFTGPLYFVYKILHVIQQTEELNAKNNGVHYVPIYWMASEDHDFEEIQSFQLFHQEIRWNSEEKGAVGRFSLDEIEEVKTIMHSFFENHPEAEIHALVDALTGENYAAAFRNLVNHLFGEYGLIILNADDKELKSLFAPIMAKELAKQFSYKAVTATNGELEKIDAKLQVHPREINLFYLTENARTRIEVKNDKFFIEGVGSFSEREMLEKLEQHPEQFSPNVILRPLYQETILPNVNYVGGMGEITYWMQLKRVFDAVNVPYPLIQVRNSLLWIDNTTHLKMQKLGLEIEDAFLPADILKKQLVENESQEELDFAELDKKANTLGAYLQNMIEETNPVLQKYGAAEVTRLEKQMENIKSKLYRQVKSRYDAKLKQIDQIKEKLFPNNALQERSTNFFQLSPDGNYRDSLTAIKENLQVFCSDLLVLFE